MKILISGSNGLIGKKLSSVLSAAGHEISHLTRQDSRSASREEIIWEPANPEFKLDPPLIEQFDSIVHLAGEPIFSLRWTENKKNRIRLSRVTGTRIIAEAITKAANFSGSLISASAVGFYGNRNAEILTESSTPGNNFLASVCREWEDATTARSG